MPWSDGLAEQWLAALEARPNTRRTYRKCWRVFAAYLRAGRIVRLSREVVLGYREWLRASGRKATTVNTYLVAVRQYCRWAAWRFGGANVADGVRSLRVPPGFRRDTLTREQASALVGETQRRATSLAGLRDAAIVAVAISTGLRTVECSRARVGDVERRGEGACYLRVWGKGRDEADALVRLAPQAEKALQRYLRGRGPEPAAPLFARAGRGGDAARLSAEGISRIIKRHLRRAGIDSRRVTAHSLRHTAATFALKNGAALAHVQQMLRHRSLDTTMLYNHAIERERNNAELLAADYFDWGERHRVEG